MKKIGTYLLYGGALIFAVAIVYSSLNFGKELKQNIVGGQDTRAKNLAEQARSADRIQVFLFHPTQRCVTCITIGKYAKETIEQKFPRELVSGKIEFREINIDLPENKELATKFKAAGSSLFINSIIDGKDNIQEDTQVWRLVSNEQEFTSYLSDKIKALL